MLGVSGKSNIAIYPSCLFVFFSAAKVINFSQLCRLLSPATKEATVLKCVQQYAVVVQGCWVVKRYEPSATSYRDTMLK